MRACKAGSEDTVRSLLKQGANVNYVNKVRAPLIGLNVLLCPDTPVPFFQGGVTALQIACIFGHQNVIELLLQQQADPAPTNVAVYPLCISPSCLVIFSCCLLLLSLEGQHCTARALEAIFELPSCS